MVQKLELFPTSYEYSIGKYNNLKEMFVRGDVDISGGTGITYSNGSISISSIPYYTASKQTNSQHSQNTGPIPVTGFHNYACNPRLS